MLLLGLTIGLGLFVLLLGLTWLKCSSIVRIAKRRSDAGWARDLGSMLQVSLVGYLSAGAFLGLCYFDYVYHLIVIAVVGHRVLTTASIDTGPAAAPSNAASLPGQRTPNVLQLPPHASAAGR